MNANGLPLKNSFSSKVNVNNNSLDKVKVDHFKRSRVQSVSSNYLDLDKFIIHQKWGIEDALRVSNSL